MSTYAVRLVLDQGFDEDSQALFAEHFDGLVAEAFDRFLVILYVDAETGAEAAISGIKNLERVMHVHVRELDLDLVNMTDVATRIGRSRQNVQQLVTRERGPGGFPPPAGSPGGARVWSWGSIFFWLRKHGLVDPTEELPLTPNEAGVVGGWLASRMCQADFSQKQQDLFEMKTWSTTVVSATLQSAAVRQTSRTFATSLWSDARFHETDDFVIDSVVFDKFSLWGAGHGLTNR